MLGNWPFAHADVPHLLQVDEVLPVAAVTGQDVVIWDDRAQCAVLDVPQPLGLAIVHTLLPLNMVQPVAAAGVQDCVTLLQCTLDLHGTIAQITHTAS